MAELIDGPGICKLLDIHPRQLHAWYSRRHNSGFPEPIATRLTGASTAYAANRRRLWDKDEILAWRAAYQPLRGGASYHKRNQKASGP